MRQHVSKSICEGPLPLRNQIYTKFQLLVRLTYSLKIINSERKKKIEYICHIKPFLVNVPILYSLKTPENKRFSGVFGEYKMRAFLFRDIKREHLPENQSITEKDPLLQKLKMYAGFCRMLKGWTMYL